MKLKRMVDKCLDKTQVIKFVGRIMYLMYNIYETFDFQTNINWLDCSMSLVQILINE